jgi:hypothetical protein
MNKSQKEAPKSCSCGQCRRAKGTDYGHHHLNQKEKAHRQAAKIRLSKLRDSISADDLEVADTPIAPRGERIG